MQLKLLPLVVVGGVTRRARGREAVLRLLWESRLVMRAVAGTGAFTRMAKGLCVVPPPMDDGEIWPRWGARWGDGGFQNWAGPWASPRPPLGYMAGVLEL